MLDTIRKIKMNWLEHYVRRDSLKRSAMEGKTDGREDGRERRE